MKLFFLVSIYAVCIFACASIAKKNVLYVYLAGNSKFVLLSPEGIEHPMDMPQFLSTEFMGQNYFLNVWVKADENAIEMTFFNELGASIGELSYINGAAHFSSAVFPKAVTGAFKPEYAIADFQLCFYDPLLLDKSLKDSGLVLEIMEENRRILCKSEVIIEIKKTENTVELVNYLRGYAYTLEGDFSKTR